MAELQFKSRLQDRAEQFIQTLKRAGIDAAIVEDSFRQYSVKIFIHPNGRDAGVAVLYYSPKSDSFSLKLHEMADRSIGPSLEDLLKAAPSIDEVGAARCEIYVDGSFINGATGYGAVVLKNGKVVDELCGSVGAAEVNGTRQVAGELIAVKEALAWSRAHSVDEVDIYYDYLGIEKWATAQWKTNQPLTKEYARFVRACPIKIHWHKVDSHTGDRWNDRADALAKKGAGLVQSSAVAGDLISELVEQTERWIEFLMVNGIEGAFDRTYNEQFARINIVEKDKVVGIFDLYNTKKKRLSPYLHNFRDESLKLRVNTLWHRFRSV